MKALEQQASMQGMPIQNDLFECKTDLESKATAVAHPVISALKALDPNSLSPIDALNQLHQLREQIQEEMA